MKLILIFLFLILSGSMVFAQKVGVIGLEQIADIDTINIVRTDWVAFLLNNSPVRTLSTNGAAGNVSISGGNSITLNVNDHSNRTALDAVSGINTGNQNHLIDSVSYSNNILQIREAGHVWQTEIISSASEADMAGYFNTEFEPTTSYSMTFPMDMNTLDYFLWLRAYQKDFVNGDSVQVSVAMKNLQKTASGFSVDLKNDSCYVTYLAMDTLDWKLFTFENYITWLDTATTDTMGIVQVDGSTISIKDGIISVIRDNDSTQHFSGTNIAWDARRGKNADLTLTGNTLITLSNLPLGKSGTIEVANASTEYTIQFAGYSNILINNHVSHSTDKVRTSGGGNTIFDSFSWFYDGIKVKINGSLNYAE